jgi:butyrate kinase
MSETYKILVVNPGSTSTKLGLFENETLVAEKKVEHSAEDIAKYPTIIAQTDLRRQVMDDFLKEINVKPEDLSAVVGRGGLLKAIPSGTYAVNDDVVNDLKISKYGEHASNMGALLANSFNKDYSIPAFIVDPPVVDGLQDIARFTGIKEIPRKSVWHALNIMAVTRMVAKNENLNLKDSNFVVAHLGGGISVAAIQNGDCIDVSNGLSAGPFTPERAGALPTLELAELCFSGKYTHAEIKKLLVGRGGVVNYLGTSSLMDVENKVIAGDKEFTQIFEAMCYQIAKEIGSYVAVLKGKVTRIIITGGGAKCPPLVKKVKEYVENFATVVVVPGEDELSALAMGGLRVLRNESQAKVYKS